MHVRDEHNDVYDYLVEFLHKNFWNLLNSTACAKVSGLDLAMLTFGVWVLHEYEQDCFFEDVPDEKLAGRMLAANSFLSWYCGFTVSPPINYSADELMRDLCVNNHLTWYIFEYYVKSKRAAWATEQKRERGGALVNQMLPSSVCF